MLLLRIFFYTLPVVLFLLALRLTFKYREFHLVWYFSEKSKAVRRIVVPSQSIVNLLFPNKPR
ncbi:hypothetical protein SAMN02745220_04690 [Desulfopila aestuarii DSM 18488]|uniref:Uncharacterized protein n=1 Tax=Desulfopila aestuarii DSM 18488 TaxID=1121416 RepID=A0A1M7YJA5_9BACT|nr:hypothetical protein SAMN02745220_04690 [Desulfopila aestuarii DSM 18488]